MSIEEIIKSSDNYVSIAAYYDGAWRQNKELDFINPAVAYWVYSRDKHVIDLSENDEEDDVTIADIVHTNNHNEWIYWPILSTISVEDLYKKVNSVADIKVSYMWHYNAISTSWELNVDGDLIDIDSFATFSQVNAGDAVVFKIIKKDNK